MGFSHTLRHLSMGVVFCVVVLILFDVVRVEELQCPQVTTSRWFRKEAPVDFDQYNAMLKRIKTVQASCGQLCNSSLKGTPSKYFDNIRVPVDCNAIFKEALIDSPREQTVAPEDLPVEYFADFTLNGKFPMRRYPCGFYNEVYLTSQAAENKWSKELVEDWKEQAGRGVLEGTYGAVATNALKKAVEIMGVKGKRCLVIGSERPWVEAVLLAAGAASVVTLEYGKIHSTHPQVVTMLPSEFTKAYFDGSLGMFDSVVTYSSVEHAGLGRYGDALLPWADLLAVARGWCVTRPGGDLAIAVPSGPDELLFNAHRRYGPARYPFLAANWQQVVMVPALQPVYLFKKQDPLSEQ